MSTFQDYLVHGAALAGAGYLASKYYNCRCHFADANPKNGSRILTQAEAEYRSSVLSQVCAVYKWTLRYLKCAGNEI